MYIERLVIAVLLLLLLALAPSMARTVVYKGQTTPLTVEQKVYDTYKWELYSDSTVNFAVAMGSAVADGDAEFVGDNTGSTVNVLWKRPGIYFYKVTALDVAGCAMNLKVGIIEVKEALTTATILAGNVVCAGEMIELEVTLTGKAPWSFIYTDGTDSLLVTDVMTNTYVITIETGPTITTDYWIASVTDYYGSNEVESEKTTQQIYPLPAMAVATTTIQPTCNNKNGTVVIDSPIGANLLYSIDGGDYQASAVFDSLQWGEHSVSVKNTLTQCTSTGTIEVTAIPAPVLTAVTEASICYGGLGSISFNVLNAIDGVYTIKYTDGEFPEVKITDGISEPIRAFAGDYNNLTIYNAATGCDSYDADNVVDVTIGQPEPIVIDNTIVPLNLKNKASGAILLNISGGSGNYSFSWDNGQTTKDIHNLEEGNFRVMVTDENGCRGLKTIAMPGPNLPPVALGDEYTSGCKAVRGNVLDNDSDPDGDEIFTTKRPVVAPRHGTLTLEPDGSFIYIGDPLFSGTDSFVYALFDKTMVLGITAKVRLHIYSDIDHDGIADADDLDADGDGILNIYEALSGEDWRIADRDGDGLPNYLDIDADGDGIVDNFEAQSTAYRSPFGFDADSNGVDDAYDKRQSGFEILPIDTDDDGVPDFLDADSDNDLVLDYIEGHDADANGIPDRMVLGHDSDGDGLDDIYDLVVNDCGALLNALGSNASMQDFDGDGMPDWRDEDDDDDNILTKFEDINGDGDFSNDDIDYDGYPEYLDFGRECDMFIPDAFSPNGDGIHDYYQIYCINHYPNATIYIFDQLGNKVFEKAHYGNLEVWKAYENAWWSGKPDRGGSNARSELVAPGTYYYVLDLGNGEVKKSFVFVSY